jgi:hypothetical protein
MQEHTENNLRELKMKRNKYKRNNNAKCGSAIEEGMDSRRPQNQGVNKEVDLVNRRKHYTLSRDGVTQ